MAYRQGATISIGNVSLPNIINTGTTSLGPPPPINGQVTCSLHKKTRAMKFVQTKPILNAEGTTVGYTYHCTEESPCLVGPQQQQQQKEAAEAIAAATGNEKNNEEGSDDEDFDIDGPSQKSNDGMPPAGIMKKLGYDGVRTTTTGNEAGGLGGLLSHTGGAIPQGLFGDSSSALTSPTTPNEVAGARFTVGAGNTAGRAPNRYYDMSKKRDDSDFKKVCWSCGMDTHEKPQCPNLLCRNCHDKQEAGYEGRMNHRCSRVGLSAFVLLDTDLLDTFMAAEELAKHNKKMASSSTPSSSRLTFDDAAFVNPALLTTRCPRCNQMGHMDCPHPLSAHRIERDRADAKNNDRSGKSNGKKKTTEDEGIARKLSCCGCASSDHSGYECPSRPRDYWRERVLGVAVSQLGMDEVKDIVAIDERVPTNFKTTSDAEYDRGYKNNSNAARTNAANFGKRDRDEDEWERWSADERRGGNQRRSRGEYDSSYARSGGRRGNSLSYSDSDSDSYRGDRNRKQNYQNQNARQGGDSKGNHFDNQHRGGGGNTPSSYRDDSRRHQGTFAMQNAVRNHASHTGRIETGSPYARQGAGYPQHPPQQQQQGYGGGRLQPQQQGGNAYAYRGPNNSTQQQGYQRPLAGSSSAPQHQNPQQRGGNHANNNNQQHQYHTNQNNTNNYNGPNRNGGNVGNGPQSDQRYTNRSNLPPPNRAPYNKRGFEF